MKGKGSLPRGGRSMSGNKQVRVEIETFLQALVSYPDYFAVNPRTTFEQYHSSLTPEIAEQAASRVADEQ